MGLRRPLSRAAEHWLRRNALAAFRLMPSQRDAVEHSGVMAEGG